MASTDVSGCFLPLQCRFRFFVLFIISLVNISVPLSTRNMIYAIQPMINHSALEVHYETDDDFGYGSGSNSSRRNLTAVKPREDTCHGNKSSAGDKQDGSGARHDNMRDGPYLFDDRRQALILSVLAVGQLFGTLFSLLIYDFCYMGPILSISVCWCGLLNLFLPGIAAKAGSVGVIISRFSIGLYIGLLTPINSAIVHNWYRTSERDMVNAIINSGSNVGNTLFAFSGLVVSNLGWEALFWIPGAFSILCGLLVFAFFTDDPTANHFLSEAEKKLLSDKLTTRDDYAHSLESKTNKKAFKRRTSFHMFNVAIARVTRRKPAPWFKALGYLQFWALLSCIFGHHWACEATITYTQIYLTEIHDYSLSKASFLNTVP